MTWRDWARGLRREVYTLYFACKDNRVPWYAKALAIGVVAYALSPVDLIPDFIPGIGHLDDLIIVPLGVMAVRLMVPENVLAECRERAAALETKPMSKAGAVVVVGIWLVLTTLAILWMARFLRRAVRH